MTLSKSSLSLQALGQHGRSLLHLPLSPSSPSSSSSSHCYDSGNAAVYVSCHKQSGSEPDINASQPYGLLPAAKPEPPPLSKRRSRLGLFTVLIPSLISHPADTPGSPPSQALRRKPVPAQSPSPPATKPPSPSPAVNNNTTPESPPDPMSPDSLPPPSDSSFDFSFDVPAARAPPASDSYFALPMLPKPSPPSHPASVDVTATNPPVEVDSAPADTVAQIPPAPTTPPPPVPSKSRDRTPPGHPDIQLIETAPSPKAVRTQHEPRLSKTPDDDRRSRSNSIQALASQKLRLVTGDRGSSPSRRLRSSSAQPPATRAGGPDQARTVSAGSRPVSTYSSDDTGSPHRRRVRKSFFAGGRSRSNSQDIPRIHNSPAWIISDGSHAEYSTTFLVSSDRVPELWNESADVYVHLHPRETGCSPSFKVPSSVIFSSKVFMDQIREDVALTPTSSTRSRARSFGGRDSLTAEDATRVQTPPLSGTESPGEYRIFIPPTPGTPKPTGFAPVPPSKPDMERLIAVRNLFAFLTGQKLVGTKASPTVFSAFMAISHLLREFEFSSPDGETYGEIPDVSFSWYLGQIPLADVRHSREKTLEALVLAEAMRSRELFNEAFAHAVGKWAAIKDTKSPLLKMLSGNVRKRLERGDLDLAQRQAGVNNKLEQFDFPALFAGIANSGSAGKEVKFAKWRASFMKMRSFVLGYYKSTLGSWPPRASSKKNPFSESGLNRQVLRILYGDFCALYDLLVDRESLTPRVDNALAQAVEDSASGDSMDNSTAIHYLRKILDEYDTSTPPVLPPIPFDIPMLPAMTSVYENYSTMSAKEQLNFDKKIQPHELLLVLSKAYNIDTYSLNVPFLEQFKEFETKEARGGKPLVEIVDQRIGYWLFLYAVIQALPNLVVDCPDLKYTEGVEYFLCQPHMGALPWVEEPTNQKILFQVANGAIVELPADSVAFSVEAVYHRSHCWVAGKTWEEALHMGPGEVGGLSPTHPARQEPIGSPLEPPNPGFADVEPSGPSPHSRSPSLPPTGGSSPSAGSPQHALRPRNQSPIPRGRAPNRANHHYRSSIALGIEPLALPEGFSDPRRSRVTSTNFDALAARPATSSGLRGSVSHGNLQQLLAESSPRSESPVKDQASGSSTGYVPGHGKGHGSQGGSTFDDILGKVDKKEKKSKKWGFF